MLPKQAVSSLIGELNGRIPPPVHTAGIEEERPVPAVMVENVDIEHQNHHNSTYAGSEYDSSGDEQAEVHRHYYDLRIQLIGRDNDEVSAYEILGQLQQALGEISRAPRSTLHDHVTRVRILGSGEVSYQFLEPTETEVSQSVLIETFYETSGADAEPIQDVIDSYDIS